MKRSLQIVALLVAFGAGAITHSLWRPEHSSEDPINEPASRRTPPFNLSPQRAARAGPQKHAEKLKSVTAASLTVQTEVIEALLSGGRPERQFSRMGLTDVQIETVSRIQKEGIKALKLLESRHSRAVSDEQGNYIEIAAFPQERRQWLEAMESELHDLLGDDRAAVVARMIAFSDNDEDIGKYRRELFVTELEQPEGGFRIEERTFNEQGQHIDSDYDLVGNQSQSRWGHLLDLSAN